MSQPQKIAVLTGTRAEYGLLSPLLQLLQKDPAFELQLLVTGTHLSEKYGHTIDAILSDGYTPAATIDILDTETSNAGVARSAGKATAAFAEAFARLQPDLLVVLGDRYESFAVVAAATIMHVPVAHLHGGELTFGAIDEAFRHAITKMAHLHFTAAEEYRRRVIRMGEQPATVFNVGAIGIDNIRHFQFLDRAQLESSGVKTGSLTFLVTFHPETIGQQSQKDFAALIEALEAFSDATIIITYPNADAGGQELVKMVDAFAARSANVQAFASLGQLRYLSLMKLADAVIGNSSSGIIEAPALGVPTVNIGDRQEGRIRAASVIDCAPVANDIREAIATAVSPAFREKAKTATNPYGSGNAADQIIAVLRKTDFASLLKKKFYDLD